MKNSAYCLAGLWLIVLLGACGQTTETSSAQLRKTKAQAEFTGVQSPAQTQTQGRQFPYAPDEVMVKFKAAVKAKTIAEIRTELKLETIQKFTSPNLFLMKITDGTSVETIIKRLKAYEAVKYAEPNYGVKTTR
jgi:hypothetical protein